MVRVSFLLCLVVSLPCLTVAMLFDVKRYSMMTLKDGNEPYIPTNVFVNKDKKRSICLFMYCWKHHANCLTAADCCSCKCRNSSTFFSEPLGCKERHNLTATAFSRGVGQMCAFTTLKFGFDYVPLFNDPSKFVDVDLVLPLHRNFPLQSANIVCRSRGLYEHDYHGQKRLFHKNGCGELFSVRSKSGKKVLSFTSANESLWNVFRGRLLSLDLTCVSRATTFTSCFLFQVEGKYVEERYGDGGESEAVIPSSCSMKMHTTPKTLRTSATAATTKTITTGTTITTTTTATTLPIGTSKATTKPATTIKSTTTASTTKSPAKSSTSIVPSTPTPTPQHSDPQTASVFHSLSKTSQPSSTNANQYYILPVKDSGTRVIVQREDSSPTKLTVVYVKDTLTGTTIGVLTGLGTGIAIVMVCIIVWIFLKKRTNLFKTPPRSSGNTPIFNPQGGGASFEVAHYDVPNANNIQPIPLLPHSPPQTPLATVMSQTMLSTMEGDLFSSRAYSSRRNTAMSMRPLPNEAHSGSLDRQYSSITERTDLEDGQDYENQENVVLLNSDMGESVGYCRQYSSISERDQGYEEPVRSFEDAGLHTLHGSLNNRGSSRRNRDLSQRPSAEKLSYPRQCSYLSNGKGDHVDADGRDFDGCSSIKSRGSGKMGGGGMSNRPLPEKPMESVNQYYSVASLGSEKSDKISEGNDLYSLYSTIDDLQQ